MSAGGWQAHGVSVRGAAHVRDGLPNQDGVGFHCEAAPPRHAVAAVADGHGGARHFRSALGAVFAVETAVEVLRDLASTIDAARGATLEHLVAATVPERIAQGWRERASAHLDRHALTADELARVARLEGSAVEDSVRAEPLLAYGATVLAALATDAVVAFAQIGDGDILAVDAAGRTSRPIPPDARLVGNVTTSLCTASARHDFRTAVIQGASAAPRVVLLATDGYANSFRTDADFLMVGRDYAAMVAAHGAARVAADLEDILREASEQGSGDDITLALLTRMEGRP